MLAREHLCAGGDSGDAWRYSPLRLTRAQIQGTEKADFLNESQRGDKITALAGNDEVVAGT